MFAIFSLACLLYCAYIGIKAASSKLRELPGPLLARISSYYRVWLLSTGRGPAEYLELHRKYGSVVRTGPHHVSFSDPAMISVVYDLKHRFHKVSRLTYEHQFLLYRLMMISFSEPFLRRLQTTVPRSPNGHHFHYS